MEKGNYLKDVLKAGAKVAGQPGAFYIEVQHDDWCPKLKGGSCNCNPDVMEPVMAKNLNPTIKQEIQK